MPEGKETNPNEANKLNILIINEIIKK